MRQKHFFQENFLLGKIKIKKQFTIQKKGYLTKQRDAKYRTILIEQRRKIERSRTRDDSTFRKKDIKKRMKDKERYLLEKRRKNRRIRNIG